jgi:hypothetical protein
MIPVSGFHLSLFAYMAMVALPPSKRMDLCRWPRSAAAVSWPPRPRWPRSRLPSSSTSAPPPPGRTPPNPSPRGPSLSSPAIGSPYAVPTPLPLNRDRAARASSSWPPSGRPRRAGHADRGPQIRLVRAPQMPVGGFAAALGFKLPSVRTEYYNTDGGGLWGRALDEYCLLCTVAAPDGPGTPRSPPRPRRCTATARSWPKWTSRPENSPFPLIPAATACRSCRSARPRPSCPPGSRWRGRSPPVTSAGTRPPACRCPLCSPARRWTTRTPRRPGGRPPSR